ncbi:hypothetical protein JEQ12_002024, partial [Ovis aries]
YPRRVCSVAVDSSSSMRVRDQVGCDGNTLAIAPAERQSACRNQREPSQLEEAPGTRFQILTISLFTLRILHPYQVIVFPDFAFFDERVGKIWAKYNSKVQKGDNRYRYEELYPSKDNSVVRNMCFAQ